MGQAALVAIPAIMSLAGGAMGAAGSAKSAAAANKAAKYNAQIEMDQAQQEVQRLSIQGRRMRSQNVVNVAKNGLRLQGSALDVLASNAFDIAQQQVNITRAAIMNARLLKLQGKAGVVAGRYAGAASVLSGAAGALQGLNQGGYFTPYGE